MQQYDPRYIPGENPKILVDPAKEGAESTAIQGVFYGEPPNRSDEWSVRRDKGGNAIIVESPLASKWAQDILNGMQTFTPYRGRVRVSATAYIRREKRISVLQSLIIAILCKTVLTSEYLIVDTQLKVHRLSDQDIENGEECRVEYVLHSA